MIEVHSRAADMLGLERGGLNRDLSVEQRDIHEIDDILANSDALDHVLAQMRRHKAAAGTSFAPHRRKRIRGMGTVWDYRGFTRPNGGAIRALVFVEHIPVIRQMDGRADLDVLWRVLVNQGLMVHNGSDGEGNVALYLPLNKLAYHARGANSISIGTEHMHRTTDEDWSNRQLNAAAYLSWRAKTRVDMPHYRGRLGSGDGYVTVRRRGHTTHEAVSRRAGFNDRSDPGEKYEALMSEIRERALFYGRHRRF